MQRSHSMRRREFLRGLVVAGGDGLVCDGRIAAFASQEVRKSQSITPAVKPIRGLEREVRLAEIPHFFC